MSGTFANPFSPRVGHRPPYLAGRVAAREEFRRLLRQEVILENLVLTGLRGVGKTVLLDALEPIAIEAGWLWVGTDLSESSSISEDRLALRLLTDLSVATAAFQVAERERFPIGFARPSTKTPVVLNYATLEALYGATPGLASDKLKKVLEIIWGAMQARPGPQG